MSGKDEKKRDESPLGDWMKVMLEEIDRKRVEQEEAERELERRGDEPAGKPDENEQSPGAGE